MIPTPSCSSLSLVAVPAAAAAEEDDDNFENAEGGDCGAASFVSDCRAESARA